MAWHNRTKIVATLGPASHTDEIVTDLMGNGVDVFRINCAHADHETIGVVVNRIRRLAKRLDRAVGILADLQGPKIRVGKLKNAEPIYLKRGDVMNDDQIDAYIELKMKEVQRLDMTPHPVEFQMYYSV